MSAPVRSVIQVWAPDGVGEVREGDDLAALLLPLVELHDGDIVVVTSKVVSKSEGRVVAGTTREDTLAGETRRVVARRGPTTIVRNRLGLTMAAAGIDASNVASGSVVLLPLDPDASARRLRSSLSATANVGVIVTDTAGRPWRDGQTDIAIGAAGVVVAERFEGRYDEYGNPLVVTAPAVADEIAGAAELSQGKLGKRPFAVVRGRADLVLPPDHDGLGAAALIRPDGADLFGYGAREAVVRALLGRRDEQHVFGAPASAEELAEAVRLLGGTVETDGSGLRVSDVPHVAALVFAHGWEPDPSDGARVRPTTT